MMVSHSPHMKWPAAVTSLGASLIGGAALLVLVILEIATRWWRPALAT